MESGNDSPPPWLPGSFVERIGAALAAPRRALSVADSEQAAGKAGTDLALLILFGFVALHTAELVVAAWLVKAEGVRVGFTALGATFSRALARYLVVLFVAGVTLTLAAGRHRSFGRDFDLACVAFVPYLIVEVVARGALAAAHVSTPAWASQVIDAAAYAWALGVWWLAVSHARRRELP